MEYFSNKYNVICRFWYNSLYKQSKFNLQMKIYFSYEYNEDAICRLWFDLPIEYKQRNLLTMEYFSNEYKQHACHFQTMILFL